VMNFAQQGFLSFFAGAQLGGHVLGDFCLLHEREDPGNDERKNHGRGHGGNRGEQLYRRR